MAAIGRLSRLRLTMLRHAESCDERLPNLRAASVALAAVWAGPACACSDCVPLVHATAFAPGFGKTLCLLMLPLLPIALLVVAVHGLPGLGRAGLSREAAVDGS